MLRIAVSFIIIFFDVVILVLSLFIYRPWCHFLCPFDLSCSGDKYFEKYDELGNRLNELPNDTAINAYCGVGIQSNIACRILMQNGFTARNISGGYITYCSHENKELSDTQTGRQLRKEFCLV